MSHARMHSFAVLAPLVFALVLALPCALAGCAAEVTGEGEDSALGARSAALDLGPLSLAFGERRTLVEGITGAENLLFTSDGRLLVTADAGIFEVVRARGEYRALALMTGAPCQFGGIVELDGTLYANCYDATDSHLYAAALEATPRFRSIHELPGVVLANGLAAGDDGSLYVAATLQGQILRVRLSASDPFTVEGHEVWLSNPGLFVNGLKLHAGALYWSDLGAIKTAPLRRDGRAGRVRTLISELAFLDDLFVDDATILVTSVFSGTLRAYDRRGVPLGSTFGNAVNGPSAVLPAQGRLGLSRDALVVSERAANRVSVFQP